MIKGFQTTCREQTVENLRDRVQSTNLPTVIVWDHHKQKGDIKAGAQNNQKFNS